MNKATGGDGLPAKLLQILKYDTVKMLHSMSVNSEISPVAIGLEKVSLHSNPKEEHAKECSNYPTIALISHASKAMFKIFQARLQQYMNQELPDVQAGFRKGRGTKYQNANIHWIIEKARKFQKNIYFYFIDYAKAFECMLLYRSQQMVENSLRDGNTRPPYLSPEKPI